jgi:aminoglycoside phosphotransferase (APT) family kinase protein
MDGVDVPKVTTWFEQHVDGVKPPLDFELIAGGRSNLTYKVTDAADQAYVLRRPPLGHVLATAHDMGREHRIISALAPTAVPVAPTLGLCTDEAVNGSPFYVMAFVEGVIVRDTNSAITELPNEATRAQVGRSLVEALVAIHDVDPDAVGLGDLGRKDGYIARQLKRWYGQFQKSNELTGRPVPEIDEMHAFLSARIPPQGPATIVHGDYRLDNTMLGEDGTVAAVLDWELCTLGDPLADVGLLMVYWSDPGDPGALLGVSATSLDAFPRKAELRERYAARSGRDVSHLDFYVSFGYWKLACILEGVFARYAGGAMGGDQTSFDGFSAQVTSLAHAAKNAAASL